jgi:hypothetical protein
MTLFAAMQSDAIGTKLPMRHVGSRVANGGKANELSSSQFGPTTDIAPTEKQAPGC